MKIAVIEDNEYEMKNILSCLNRFSKEYAQPLTVKTFLSAELFFWSDEEFDIIFIDIQLPGENGFSAAKKIREKRENVIIVFVTNMAQYAIKGYEVNARDYIIKPVIYREFKYKMKKLTDSVAATSNSNFTVKTGRGLYVFGADKLKYLEINNHTLIYHLTDENIERTGSLAKIEDELKGCGFLRCNRCFYVNPHYISKIEDNLVYIGEETLTISRPQKKSFLEAFKKWLMDGGI